MTISSDELTALHDHLIVIPDDQLSALANAHIYHGRKAKAMIRQAWLTGNYDDFRSRVDVPALQRFRNASYGGPSGLQKINLKSLTQNGGK